MTITLGTFEIICLICCSIFATAGILLNIKRENDRQDYYEMFKRKHNKVVIYADYLKELFTKRKVIIDTSLSIKYEISIQSSIRQLNKEELIELKHIFSQWVDDNHVYKDAIIAKVSESDLEKLHKLTSKK